MLLSKYVEQLNLALNQSAETGLVAHSDIQVDYRSETLGLIKGLVHFINDSKLHFTEYVDVETDIEKFSYSYHYQDSGNQLIFRYDNAAHKPDLGFESHKHIGEDIIFSEPPHLDMVLNEILLGMDI